MNAIRCPQCGTVNQMSATGCRQCFYSFANLPSTAYVSVSPQELYGSAQAFGGGGFSFPQDNETGRKTFFWYRVYCALMAALYLLVAVGGAYLFADPHVIPDNKPEETMIAGAIYGIISAVFFFIFAVALVLPRKSYNWIVGIIMMALGLTSCCLMPFLVPLLINWVKPETKAYFGRK